MQQSLFTEQKYWGVPPIIKIPEAIGALADERVELVDDSHAKVYSSTLKKYYEVEFDLTANLIMANDNGAYWQNYLSYPAIAVLMLKGMIEFPNYLLEVYKGIAWNQINQKFKNNYEKVFGEINIEIEGRGYDIVQITSDIFDIYEYIKTLKYMQLGKKKRPPE